ncbi:MAG TPA: nitrile hydratase subunit beta [Candidatus Binataceae bacterium]|nr:nitrile hydratase subunit beta [Candidatus Binataceae bacterium]
MNGVHDLGGMHGFGPVIAEPNEPVFHADWERRTFALALATMGGGHANVDEFRRVIERMEPAHYLASSYYEHWLHALESILTEKGVLRDGEIDAAINDRRLESVGGSGRVAASGDSDTALWSNPDAGAVRPSAAVALRHDPKFKARFKPGDRVIVRNLNPEGHTRAPRYTRGRRGVVHRDWGSFIFPDAHALGIRVKPQHCYAIQFAARELWGPSYPAGQRVYVDLWEAYIDFDAAAKSGLKRAAKAANEISAAKPKLRALRTRAATAPAKISKKIETAQPPAPRRGSSRARLQPAGKGKKRR